MSASEDYIKLIDTCRNHCLWFMAPDQVPADREAQVYTLDCVERYGRRDEFLRARELKAWLLQHTNEAFVVS